MPNQEYKFSYTQLRPNLTSLGTIRKHIESETHPASRITVAVNRMVERMNDLGGKLQKSTIYSEADKMLRYSAEAKKQLKMLQSGTEKDWNMLTGFVATLDKEIADSIQQHAGATELRQALSTKSKDEVLALSRQYPQVAGAVLASELPQVVYGLSDESLQVMRHTYAEAATPQAYQNMQVAEKVAAATATMLQAAEENLNTIVGYGEQLQAQKDGIEGEPAVATA